MENYIEYSVMGFLGKIRMMPDCLPSKFQCQPDRIKRTAPSQPRSAVNKRRRRMDVLQEIFSKKTEMPSTSGITSNSDFQSATGKDDCNNLQDQATQICPETTCKSIQVCLCPKIRSKAVNIFGQAKDKYTSPIKPHLMTTATSPFTIKYEAESTRNSNIRRKLIFSQTLDVSSSTSTSPSKPQLNTDTSPSVQSLPKMTSTSSDQESQCELSEGEKKIEAENLSRMSLENTIRSIKNNPRYYIGIPKDCYFLIDIIGKHTMLPEEHNYPFFMVRSKT